MNDPRSIPDPGPPMADGYYLECARRALRAAGIRSPAAFRERYGVDIRALTPFGLLYVIDPARAERERHLNALYRSGRGVARDPPRMLPYRSTEARTARQRPKAPFR